MIDDAGIHGLVVVDKPAGMTSHDVVDRIRRVFGTKRVGHAGTLDPDATGILVVGLGHATRFLSYAQEGPKRYSAVVVLGAETSTQDASGDVIAEAEAGVSVTDVEAVLDRFRGEIEQIPPMVSAVRVGGRRLYELARKGKVVDRAPRRVTIHDLLVVNFEAGDRPEVTLDVCCSSGTYVRTLAHDIGRVLGCGGHLGALRRTEAGGFTEADAISLDDVGLTALRPIGDAVKQVASVEVDEPARRLVDDGRPLELPSAQLDDLDDGECVAILHSGRLLGVYRRNGQRLLADRVVAT